MSNFEISMDYAYVVDIRNHIGQITNNSQRLLLIATLASKDPFYQLSTNATAIEFIYRYERRNTYYCMLRNTRWLVSDFF